MNVYDYNYIVKYIIIGDTGVGKSCLLQQFIDNKFMAVLAHTIAIEFASKIIRVGDQKVKLQIWDTAGQERFRSVTRSYYRNTAIALLVYDVTRRNTFTDIITWLEDARNSCGPQTVLILVGNKADLEEKRQVSKEEGSKFAAENGLMFAEASAKSSTMTEEIFQSTAKEVLRRVESGQMELSSESGVQKKATLQLETNGLPTPREEFMQKCCYK